jgi:hypothetical protein
MLSSYGVEGSVTPHLQIKKKPVHKKGLAFSLFREDEGALEPFAWLRAFGAEIETFGLDFIRFAL